MTYPLVSIALCSYNGEKYIAKQLTSIINQTYKNLEIIVVDDKSNDLTVSIIESFCSYDPRIKLFVNEKNIGFNRNFEQAIGLCSGDFISISDQDDIWLPKKIETLIESLGDKGMVFSNSLFIDENDVSLNTFLIDQDRKKETYESYRNILLSNFVTGHTILFRKEMLAFFLPFPPNIFYDWWMGFVMLYEKQLVYCPIVLTHYRIHKSSVMNKETVKIQASRKNKYRIETTTIFNQLNSFKDYKGLSAKDQVFLNRLSDAFRKKMTGYYSASLFRIVLKNFSDLFPLHISSKLRKVLFLQRYCRGLKLTDIVSH